MRFGREPNSAMPPMPVDMNFSEGNHQVDFPTSLLFHFSNMFGERVELVALVALRFGRGGGGVSPPPCDRSATTERSHVITQRQLVERRMTTDPVIAGGLQTTPFALAVLRERSPKSTATTSDTGFKTLVTRGVVGHWPAASRDLRDMRNTCTCLWNAACHHQPRPVGTCTCLWDAASTGNRRGDIRASTENHRATSGRHKARLPCACNKTRRPPLLNRQQQKTGPIWPCAGNPKQDAPFF